MCDALIKHSGDMGRLIDCVTALETGEFDRAEELIPGCGPLHAEAIIWANDASDPLFSGAAHGVGEEAVRRNLRGRGRSPASRRNTLSAVDHEHGIGALARGSPAAVVAWRAVAIVLVAISTALLYPLKQVTAVSSLGVVYLLGVVIVSAFWGRGSASRPRS